MNNYTLISPFTLQVTQDNENLQKKEFCFLEKNNQFGFQLHRNYCFVEKEIQGYSNILNVISQKKKVYFLLPVDFEPSSVIKFTRDFLIACNYANLDYIVFDKSRCNDKSISSIEKLQICSIVEQMFIESNLPILFVEEKNEIPISSISPRRISFKFYEIDKREIDSKELKSVFNYLHTIFHLKEQLFLFQSVDSKIVDKQDSKSESFRYNYTLN